ncbi:tetratricopeptide repeat protein [Catenuloplanes indicus]|uniref:Tetratricopeptide (TPR) repeat protein n=1 Tax=Catenuloplanes indicus TaxID=137267 RepID=A0AAE3VVE3_9ACTN|nr:tetratricopeptide repeat protein [Catenuloplanes indicus]MDQ0364963.1 tetratricopeptide (TPR) repeat protein [Catenuloplanes indicus]
MAWARLYAAWALGEQGRNKAALTASEQAVDLFDRAGNRTGVANALIGLSLAWQALGRHADALAALERAVAVLRDPAAGPAGSITTIPVTGALCLTAEIHLVLHADEAAVQAATAALRTPGLPMTAPARSRTLRARARAYQQLGDISAARADLDAVLEIKKVDRDETTLRKVKDLLRALPAAG